MRIEFNNIRFKNFLCFGSKIQEVNLINGLNLVTGIDEDNDGRSNGSGKTSLLETIPFALYGATHKLVKKSEIINWKNRKNCEVAISFTKGKNNYDVLRGIKPNILNIYKNDKLVDRPPHIRDYQLILDDIIGLNFQSFISLIHSNINSSMPITVMNKPDKRKFMEKIFKLKIYSAMNEKCNSKVRVLNQKITSHSKDIEFNDSKVELLHTEIKNIMEKRILYSEKTKSLEKHTEEYNNEVKKHLGINEKFEELNIDLTELSVDLDKFKNTDIKIGSSIQIIDVKTKNIIEQMVVLEKELELEQESNKYKDKIKQIEQKYGSIDNIYEIIENLHEKIEECDSKKDFVAREKEDNQRIIITMESQVNNLKEKISSLESHSICPLCEQSVKGNLNVVETWRDNLYEIEVQLKRLYVDNKASTEDFLKLNILIRDFREKIRIKNKIKEGLSKLKLKLSEYNVDENKNKIQVLKLKKKKYLSVRIKLDNIKKKITGRLTDTNGMIDIIIKQKDEVEKIINNIQKMEKNIEVLKREVIMEDKMKEDLSSQIKEKNEKIVELTKNVDSIMYEIKKFNSIIDYLTFIKETCKDENIKQFAISSNIPYLNEKLNYYLSQVGHNFYILLDNWLDMQIKGPGIFNGSYGSLSAGESKCIDLAMQFAFLDISRLQSGAFIDLLIEDEILDSSVDGIGLPKIMEILRLKQKEDNLKTFIISHRNEIDNLEIDNVYQVIKKNGYSTVSII